MCALLYAIRCKPDWETKLRDPAVRGRWKAEALEQSRGEPLRERVEEVDMERAALSKRMVDYVHAREEAWRGGWYQGVV